jgi:hypothetical protein
MRFSSRLTVGILITAVTLIVCSLGVRAELKIAQNSAADRRAQPAPEPVRTIAVAQGEQPSNIPPR